MTDGAPPRGATWGAFFGCSLIWGSTFLVISFGNDTMPPLWGASLRLALATAILFAIVALRRLPLPTGPALKSAIAYGALLFGVNFPLLYWGQQWVPSGIAAVAYATLPLTTPFMARAFGLEKLRPLKTAGGGVALAGVVVIFWRQIVGDTGLIPMLAVFGAATFGGLGTIQLKRGPRQHPIPASAVGSLVGLPMCLAFSFLLAEPHRLPTTAGEIVPILYLTILGSVVAFTLLAWLVNHWDASNIAFISVVNPVTAITLGIVVRHERFEATTLLGASLVLAGVLMAVQSDRMASRQAARAG